MSAKTPKNRRAAKRPTLPKYVRMTTSGAYQVFMASTIGGKQQTQGTYTTVEQAAARAHEVLRGRQAATVAAQSTRTPFAQVLTDMTVAGAFEAWHAGQESRQVDRDQWIADAAAARRHIFPTFGTMRMDDLRRRAVEQWATAKVADDGYAVSTVRRWIGWLRQTSRWYVECCREEGVYSTPAVNVSDIRLAPPTKPISTPRATHEEPYSIAIFREILLQMPEPFRVIGALQYCVGLRVGEAFGLSPFSIDWELGIAYIVQQVSRGVIRRRVKTDTSVRELPLPSIVLEMLHDYVVHQHGEGAIRPYDPATNGRDLLIVTPTGSSDTQIAYFRAFQSAVDAVMGPRFEWRNGIGDVRVKTTPHFFRKTFNTHVTSQVVHAGKGVRMSSLLAYMGHSPDHKGASSGSSQVNERYYQLGSSNELRIIAASVDEMLRAELPDGLPVRPQTYVRLADVATHLGVSRKGALRAVRRLGIETFEMPDDRRWTAIRAIDFDRHFGGGAAGDQPGCDRQLHNADRPNHPHLDGVSNPLGIPGLVCMR